MTDQISAIPKGWKMTTLGEVSDIKGGKRLPKDKNLVNQRTKHPYIRITDLENNQIKKTQLQFVPDEVFPSISRYIVNSGDVIVSIVGSIGFVARIDDDLDNASLTENCVKFVNLKNLDSKFLYYFLISKLGQDEIVKNTVGAVQKKLPIYGVQNIQICLSSLSEQSAIAAVLSSLDDKIELLREQNKTLEATAQAIFKEWFVNFNFPGDTGKMIDSELGQIPEGWRVDSLSKIAVFLNGLALQKFPPESATEYLPVIKIRELSAGISLQTDRASARLDKRYVVEDGDILFSWSGSLVVDIWKYGKGALNQHLFKVTSEDFPKWFYYHWTKEHLASFQQIATAKAVTMGHIQRHHLGDALVVIPDDKFLKIADAVFAPMLEKFINNNSQIQILSTLRDTLLPKLMKGEIRVEGFNNY